eukprot:5698258-Amphidinium_carterae.1
MAPVQGVVCFGGGVGSFEKASVFRSVLMNCHEGVFAAISYFSPGGLDMTDVLLLYVNTNGQT